MPRSKKGPEDTSPAKKTAAKRATSRARKASSTPEAVVAKAPVAEVNVEQKIRVRAYELFLERNSNQGDPEQDWLRAEAEIRAKLIA